MSVRRVPTSCLGICISWCCMGQMNTAAGTSLRIAEGTTVRVDTVLTWTIQPGAEVRNDGTIILSPSARLQEGLGGVIQGTGIEVSTDTHTAALVAHDASGLGLAITTDHVPGQVEVVRGHLATDDPEEGPSIARWYRVSAQTNGAATLVMRYDPSELNGLTETDLWIHRSVGDDWMYFASTVDATAHTTGASVDSLGLFTAFDGLIHVDVEDTVADPGFVLWPVPSDGLLHLRIPDGSVVRSVEVIGADGRIVQRPATGGSLSGVLTIDLTGLSPGAYHLRTDRATMIPFLLR